MRLRRLALADGAERFDQDDEVGEERRVASDPEFVNAADSASKLWLKCDVWVEIPR